MLQSEICFTARAKLWKKTYCCENRETAAYIVRNNKCFVTFFVGKSLECTLGLVSCAVNTLSCALFTVLLPIAVSGADIDALMQGAATAQKEFDNDDLKTNDCYKYAAIRNMLYRKGKTMEEDLLL